MPKRVTVVHRTQHRIALVESGEERLECSLLAMDRIDHLNSVCIQPSVVVELFYVSLIGRQVRISAPTLLLWLRLRLFLRA